MSSNNPTIDAAKLYINYSNVALDIDILLDEIKHGLEDHESRLDQEYTRAAADELAVIRTALQDVADKLMQRGQYAPQPAKRGQRRPAIGPMENR